jgi:RNA polymerase-binding transcription factor DksA
MPVSSVEQFTPHFADPENARQAGLRSAQLYKERQQELENLRHIIATKPLDAIRPPNEADLEVQQQLELTEEQIAHTRAELNRMSEDDYGFCPQCKRHGADGKERAALLRELRGLCELRLDLRGISRPGQTKPSAAPRQSRQHWPEPTPLPAPSTLPVVPPTTEPKPPA